MHRIRRRNQGFEVSAATAAWRRGFTIIELLVVMGILILLAVLTGISVRQVSQGARLSSVMRARPTFRLTSCVNVPGSTSSLASVSIASQPAIASVVVSHDSGKGQDSPG